MTIHITQELLLCTVPGGRWSLENDRGVTFDILHPKVTVFVTVPHGFHCDLNSGHFLPESWHHRSRHAALLHDYMYETGIKSRAEADYAFFLVLLNRGARYYRARMMYRAVRLFGGRAWKRHRSKSNAQTAKAG